MTFCIDFLAMNTRVASGNQYFAKVWAFRSLYSI